jgi:hypothetical protein
MISAGNSSNFKLAKEPTSSVLLRAFSETPLRKSLSYSVTQTASCEIGEQSDTFAGWLGNHLGQVW